jgi:hypothetical protein
MALILEGELPRPDHVAMTALEWERRATFAYVNAYIRPACKRLGIPFTYVPRKKYATKDFFGGEDGMAPLIPVYTNQSGTLAKHQPRRSEPATRPAAALVSTGLPAPGRSPDDGKRMPDGRCSPGLARPAALTVRALPEPERRGVGRADA